jgi:ABC-2 type transport system ATP-binding protein
MVEIRGLVKRYGAFTAVDHVDLTIERGEIFGFLGPNGAGKTTTMKTLAGLIKPTAGEAYVDGLNVFTDTLEVKRRIGYIPDRPFVYDKLTGREFLGFIAGLYELDETEAARRMESLLALFELLRFGDELIESYSHGMKQRLTMAAAFIHRPKLVIVDEPMVGLDPKGARLLKDIFRTVCKEQGATIFMSTHSLTDAEELCDRIGIIVRGKIATLGTLAEIKARAGTAELEDIFLALTGGLDHGDILQAI